MAGSLRNTGETQLEKTTGTARYEVRGKVALITLDNPPVNGMSHPVRAAMLEGLDRALAEGVVAELDAVGRGVGLGGVRDGGHLGSGRAGVQKRSF